MNALLPDKRFRLFALAATGVFGLSLYSLLRTALASDIHSHAILIPFISAYLVWVEKPLAGVVCQPSYPYAVGSGVLGLICLLVRFLLPARGILLAADDRLTLEILAYLWFLMAGGFLFLGLAAMIRLAFPAFFLFFMVPLPSFLINWLEIVAQRASAEASALLFMITGTSFLKTGVVFQLPGIMIQVGEECSGIRSSYVLFITSLLAGYLFLKNPWRRAVLALAVIPLGILRNAFRIATIALLCVHVDPVMIDSPIHRRGGPYFFILSLIPLFLMLAWFRKQESKTPVPKG